LDEEPASAVAGRLHALDSSLLSPPRQKVNGWMVSGLVWRALPISVTRVLIDLTAGAWYGPVFEKPLRAIAVDTGLAVSSVRSALRTLRRLEIIEVTSTEGVEWEFQMLCPHESEIEDAQEALRARGWRTVSGAPLGLAPDEPDSGLDDAEFPESFGSPGSLERDEGPSNCA